MLFEISRYLTSRPWTRLAGRGLDLHEARVGVGQRLQLGVDLLVRAVAEVGRRRRGRLDDAPARHRRELREPEVLVDRLRGVDRRFRARRRRQRERCARGRDEHLHSERHGARPPLIQTGTAPGRACSWRARPYDAVFSESRRWALGNLNAVRRLALRRPATRPRTGRLRRSNAADGWCRNGSAADTVSVGAEGRRAGGQRRGEHLVAGRVDAGDHRHDRLPVRGDGEVVEARGRSGTRRRRPARGPAAHRSSARSRARRGPRCGRSTRRSRARRWCRPRGRRSRPRSSGPDRRRPAWPRGSRGWRCARSPRTSRPCSCRPR